MFIVSSSFSLQAEPPLFVRILQLESPVLLGMCSVYIVLADIGQSSVKSAIYSAILLYETCWFPMWDGGYKSKKRENQNGDHALTTVRLLPLIIIGIDWFLVVLLWNLTYILTQLGVSVGRLSWTRLQWLSYCKALLSPGNRKLDESMISCILLLPFVTIHPVFEKRISFFTSLCFDYTCQYSQWLLCSVNIKNYSNA